MDIGNLVVVAALAVLVGLLGAFAVYGLVIGILGAVSGERFARCSRCGRFGLTVDERRHSEGCPVSSGPAWAGLAHGPHLRHH